MLSFDAVYARMLFAAGVRTQAELARILGIRQASISDAKKRCSIPSDWHMRLYDSCGVRPDWQRFGSGPVYDADKVQQIAKLNSDEWYYEPAEPVASFLHEPEAPPLCYRDPETRPVFSTLQMPDGSFPEILRQTFPEEFLGRQATVFRLLDVAMAPVLNKGALVAVEQAAASDGDVVAVFEGRELCFRRAFRMENGWELRAEADRNGESRYLSDTEWPVFYYGKAVWAFQPL